MGEGKNNISKTSKILGILRKAKTHHNFEDLIINEGKKNQLNILVYFLQNIQPLFFSFLSLKT